MANPNNLIRPPVLVAPPSPPNPQISPDLATLIRNMIRETIESNGPHLIQNVLNNNSPPIITDQTIEEQFRNNMNEMDKIPDVVRSLREFSGNASEFSSWKKSVERILRIYEPSKGTPRYFGILNVIRNKIIGKADIALESYNTPLDWTAISRCLTTHYAGERDIGTLEYQMTCLIQGRMTINKFYQEVYSHLSLILNKIGCMEIGEEAVHLLTDNYRAKALDTFIRGLSGDLPRLLGIKEPKSLPEALHLCLKLENQSFRAQYANNQMPQPTLRNQTFNSYIPRQQLPTSRYVQPTNSQLRFYPELAHIPHPHPNYRQQNQNQSNLYNRYQPQNPYYQPQNRYYQPQNPYYQSQNPYNQQQNHPPPRPPKPPQPMDVDESIRTKAVNYTNRPKPHEPGKRPPNASMINHPPPTKVQRNFHISSDETTNDQNYEDQYYDEYDNGQPTDYNMVETHDLTDVHFLD